MQTWQTAAMLANGACGRAICGMRHAAGGRRHGNMGVTKNPIKCLHLRPVHFNGQMKQFRCEQTAADPLLKPRHRPRSRPRTRSKFIPRPRTRPRTRTKCWQWATPPICRLSARLTIYAAYI